MSFITAFIAELQHESRGTRKILERIPAEQFNWQPHEKSMSLIQLAGHIAEIPGMFVADALRGEELDFAKSPYVSPALDSPAALLAFFEENVNQAVAALQHTNEETLNQIWTMRQGETVITALPRNIVIRDLTILPVSLDL